MNVSKSCIRPTYRKNPNSSPFWWMGIQLPPQYIGNTNLCKSNANPNILTPCPKGCRCEGQPPKRIWKKEIRNIFGIIIQRARWVWIQQPARCRPALQQAPIRR